MKFSKGQIGMITNMVNCELKNSNTVYDMDELKNLKQVLNIPVVIGSTADKFGEIHTAEKSGDHCILCKYLIEPIKCDACTYCMENLKYDEYYL